MSNYINIALVNSGNNVMNVLEFNSVPDKDLLDSVFAGHPGSVYGIQCGNISEIIDDERITKSTTLGIAVGWKVTEDDFIPPSPSEGAIWDPGDRSWIIL